MRNFWIRANGVRPRTNIKTDLRNINIAIYKGIPSGTKHVKSAHSQWQR